MPIRKYLKESIKLGDGELTVETGKLPNKPMALWSFNTGIPWCYARRGRALTAEESISFL